MNNNKKGNTNMLMIGAVVVLLLGGAFFFLNQGSSVSNDVVVKDVAEEDSTVVEENEQAETEGIVKVTIEGESFSLTPNVIQAKVGQTVRVTFKNTGGFHDFTIGDFDVATAQINGGEEETVEFVVDQAGEFNFYCSVGNHRAQGMEGVLTVTE